MNGKVIRMEEFNKKYDEEIEIALKKSVFEYTFVYKCIYNL